MEEVVPDFVQEGFVDLVEGDGPDAMPIYGIRILVYMDGDGNEWIKYKPAGDPSVNQMLAMFSRGTFLVQMEEMTSTMGEDED